jgi:hypothetical protein
VEGQVGDGAVVKDVQCRKKFEGEVTRYKANESQMKVRRYSV